MKETPRSMRHMILRGRVQGVGYRAWVEYAALERGLEGYVRNRRDGTVEAVLVGAPDSVDDMIEACRRGPPGARVTGIEQRDASAKEFAQRRPGELFSVLPTI